MHGTGTRPSGRKATSWDIGAVFKSGGQEWTVDTDMLTGSKLWAYHTVNHSTARFEDPVSMPQIHAQCHGTPDWWQARMTVVELVTPDFITVKDYKSGHRVVEVFENWQLIAYALGVCNRLGITNPNTKILLAIIPAEGLRQPSQGMDHHPGPAHGVRGSYRGPCCRSPGAGCPSHRGQTLH
jgi:hypothetical protein